MGKGFKKRMAWKVGFIILTVSPSLLMLLPPVVEAPAALLGWLAYCLYVVKFLSK